MSRSMTTRLAECSLPKGAGVYRQPLIWGRWGGKQLACRDRTSVAYISRLYAQS